MTAPTSSQADATSFQGSAYFPAGSAPTSLADATSFQGSAYFPAGSPADANNPFAFVSTTTQVPLNPYAIATNDYDCRANSESLQPSKELLYHPQEMQPHPHTQEELFMPRGPPLPSQGSLNPLGAQAGPNLLPPLTHGALESHHSQEPLPTQLPPASQGTPPSQSWEHGITVLLSPLDRERM